MIASSTNAKSDWDSPTNDTTNEAKSLDRLLEQSGVAASQRVGDEALFSLADTLHTDTSPANTDLNSTSPHENVSNAAVPTEVEVEAAPQPANRTVESFLDASTATSSTRSVANAASSGSMSFDTVSSGTTSETGVRREAAVTTTVYLALGSNLGDRLNNLREAIARLERHPSFHIAAKSRVYETESVEGGGDAPYLNAVVRATWAGSAMSLLRCVQGVEERMGRPRPPRRGPRIIDVDILLFGESIIENAHLVVPHPRMMQRAFVLRPLCDVLENGWVREFALGSL